METTKKAPSITLNNGMIMPQIGFGTGTFRTSPEEFKNVIKTAIIEHGYRMIDTATFYQNE